MRALVFLIVSVLALPAYAGNGPARLHAFLERVHSLSADFRQSVYDEDARQIDDAGGKVYIARPGRFRWDYTEPYVQEIVGDGEKVWVFDADLDQVTVRPLGDALGDTPVMLLSSDRPVEESFEVRAVEGPDGYDWAALTPHGEQTSFTEIRLGFDDTTLRVMELNDAFGQLTRLLFTNVVRNPDLDPALFRFTPPPGADVFSQ